jgi:hypothetical protein
MTKKEIEGLARSQAKTSTDETVKWISEDGKTRVKHLGQTHAKAYYGQYGIQKLYGGRWKGKSWAETFEEAMEKVK